jgi:DNA-binding NtrC family response regulator
MQALIFRAENLPEIQIRIDEAEIDRTLVIESGIGDLNQSNSGQVLIIPFPVLKAPDWPGLRVRLAQANRMFIVAGKGLKTESIMLAARDGAYDVIDTRDSRQRWRSAIERAAESQGLWLTLYGPAQHASLEGMIGESGPMRALLQTIDRLGATDVSVLIVGESGAGKECIAEALHATRGQGPFVAINCAAIPKNLLEAELFGAEKGAFTGSVKSRAGLVEQADGGTLFLDEVGEMEISLQPKLLRFLETKTARRVGGEKDYEVTLRIISATNQNMEQCIADGGFRADLFYRLSEVNLPAPPLRNRAGDIPLLVRAFIDRANERFGKNIESAEPELIRKLQQHSWPGNVRELKSVVERLVLLYDGPILREGFWETPDSINRPTASLPPLPPSVASFDPIPSSGGTSAGVPNQYRVMSKADRMDMARQLLADGRLSLTEVAARLGIHPTTLFRWRKNGKV